MLSDTPCSLQYILTLQASSYGQKRGSEKLWYDLPMNGIDIESAIKNACELLDGGKRVSFDIDIFSV